jgi:SNF2 family DNA or RNA helicase
VDLEIESSFAHWFFPHNRGKALSEKLDRQKVIMEAAFKELNVYSATGSQTMSALAESVSTLRRFTGLQKVEPVADLVASELLVDAYDKIVIFAIHRDVIEGLRVRLRTFHPVTLYGGTPGEVRQVNIDKFQRNPKYRVFIGNIHAAGTAITLTAAHHVLFIEQSWVPGDNAQAAMRCHRIGQTKPVTVRFVSIADSIDEKVSHALKRKTSELTTLFRNERDRIRDDQK